MNEDKGWGVNMQPISQERYSKTLTLSGIEIFDLKKSLNSTLTYVN